MITPARFLEYFFNASNEIGIKKNTNLTTSIENQVGHYNINTYNGTRHSSSKVFLKPVLKNPRLTMMVRIFDKMKVDRKKLILSAADKFIKENTV